MHQYILDRDSESLGGNLGQQRLGTASPVITACEDIEGAIFIELNHGSAGTHACWLRSVKGQGKTNAMTHSLIAHPPALLAPVKLLHYRLQALGQAAAFDPWSCVFRFL